MFWKYDVAARAGQSSSVLNRLTYPEPGKSRATDCLTISDCLEVRISDTSATATLEFDLLLYPSFGQDPVRIPYTAYVTPCLTATISVPTQPAIYVINRSSVIDGAQFNEPDGLNVFNLHPTILSKFVSSNPSECPVLSMHWQLFDGTPMNNNAPLNDALHHTVKIVNPDSSCWKGTPSGGETTQADCASPPTSAVLQVNNTLKFDYTFRLHAYTFAKDAYLELPIHVCGFEDLTLVSSG
jgi:hypothetical protein